MRSDEALGSGGGVVGGGRDVDGVAECAPGSGDDVNFTPPLAVDDVVTGDALLRDVPEPRAVCDALEVCESSRGGRRGGDVDTTVDRRESNGTGERGEVPATGEREPR